MKEITIVCISTFCIHFILDEFTTSCISERCHHSLYSKYTSCHHQPNVIPYHHHKNCIRRRKQQRRFYFHSEFYRKKELLSPFHLFHLWATTFLSYFCLTWQKSFVFSPFQAIYHSQPKKQQLASRFFLCRPGTMCHPYSMRKQKKQEKQCTP